MYSLGQFVPRTLVGGFAVSSRASHFHGTVPTTAPQSPVSFDWSEVYSDEMVPQEGMTDGEQRKNHCRTRNDSTKYLLCVEGRSTTSMYYIVCSLGHWRPKLQLHPGQGWKLSGGNGAGGETNPEPINSSLASGASNTGF